MPRVVVPCIALLLRSTQLASAAALLPPVLLDTWLVIVYASTATPPEIEKNRVFSHISFSFSSFH